MRHTWHGGMTGHSPSELRGLFEAIVEEDEAIELDKVLSDELQEILENYDSKPPKEKVTPRWLIGQLWNCTDIMPHYLYDKLDLPSGSTYASGSRALKDLLS